MMQRGPAGSRTDGKGIWWDGRRKESGRRGNGDEEEWPLMEMVMRIGIFLGEVFLFWDVRI